MEQFFCKTQILTGTDSLRGLSQLHIKRLFIVADPYFYENGTVNHIAHLANPEQTEVFHKVAPDPSVALVAEGTQAVRQFRPDALLAIGGGSAMDCGKAMAYFSGLSPRLIAVPTTSGSGSEVTNFAILTHNGVKQVLVDSALQPDIAVLDDTLLQALPKKLIAETGFDLISHALESWVSTGASPFSDALALQAMQTALGQLPRSYAGETSARLPMHTAATMAGMAFSSAGLGLCHAISHALGGAFHVPHGQLNAILLPAVMELNGAVVGHRYAALAQQLGFGAGSQTLSRRNLKNALIRLRKGLALPENLQQVGISSQQLNAQLEELVTAAVADGCCATNPVKVDPGLVRQALSMVQGHG